MRLVASTSPSLSSTQTSWCVSAQSMPMKTIAPSISASEPQEAVMAP